MRQFFPETWIWDETITDDSGKATLTYEAPDSITTWDLRAVALSPENGLGIAEASLTVFQPFFLQADLPYSAIRGEEFPVKIALYNYLDTPQEIQVEIEEADWFELLDDATTTVTVAGGDIGSAEFTIRPKTIGTQLVKVTARSSEAADAVIKSMIVEPEGVSRETVENVVLPAGQSRTLSLAAAGPPPDRPRLGAGLRGRHRQPAGADHRGSRPAPADAVRLRRAEHDPVRPRRLHPQVPGRDPAAQARDPGQGRDAPDHRLPARAHLPALRRQLLRLRRAGRVGQPVAHRLRAQDLRPGQGADLHRRGRALRGGRWITEHQQADGSFESVGFVCHTDMMGGVQGKDTLTAYVAIALLEAGLRRAADKAIGYLEGRLDEHHRPLRAGPDHLRARAGRERPGRQGDGTRSWSWPSRTRTGCTGAPAACSRWPGEPGAARDGREGDPHAHRHLLPSLDIEATGYATLALIAERRPGERRPGRPSGWWGSGTARAGSAPPRTRWSRCRPSPSTRPSARPTPT